MAKQMRAVVCSFCFVLLFSLDQQTIVLDQYMRNQHKRVTMLSF